MPLVIVPTAYPDMDVERIKALEKMRMVIYGNHALRAPATAMQDVLGRIRRDGEIRHVDGSIVSVEEIFRLQGMERVKSDEARFLR